MSATRSRLPFGLTAGQAQTLLLALVLGIVLLVLTLQPVLDARDHRSHDGASPCATPTAAQAQPGC